MKKYISMFMFALLVCFALVSCDTETDESAGGTAVEQMAGIWEVQVDAVDEMVMFCMKIRMDWVPLL